MVVLSPDRSRAFVSDIASGSVTVIDLEGGEVLAQIPTGRGAEGLDITPDGSELWVGNRAEDTLTIVDARSLEVEATLPCAEFPIRVKITPDGEHALVSNAESGDVAVFDADGRRELRRIAMGLTPAESADTEGRMFGSFEGPVPVGILISPDGSSAFVANTNADMLTVIDLRSWEVVRRIATGAQPDGLGWCTSAPRAGTSAPSAGPE
jgi:YVTN family beta-propeller protein